jgi:hypothetical protein
LALPRLDGVVIEHRVNAGDEPAVALARTLLGLDIAVPEDWEAARHAPAPRADSKLPQQAGLCDFLADWISPRSTG